LALHQLDPSFVVPLRMLAPKSHLERVSRWLAGQDQELQVRLARDLVASCRALDRTIASLDQELERRTVELAPALLELPGCGALTAAKLLAEIGPIGRFRSDAQLARHSGVAPLEASSGRVQRHRLDRGGQPPTQRSAPPDCDHASPLPRRRARLPRAQESRRQEPARSIPLPQTPARPRSLQHPQSESALTRASLAQDGVDVAWLLRTIPTVAPHNVEDRQRIEIARMQQPLAERD
jgi:hypothetical protein